MVVPLAAIGAVQGVLVVANRSGGAHFLDEDLEMARGFARQAALVLNLVASQAAARRSEMLEDRARIARDLHDQVIQRLFITGLGLQALASDDESGPLAKQILHHVDELDATIKDIRSTIFALRRETQRAARACAQRRSTSSNRRPERRSSHRASDSTARSTAWSRRRSPMTCSPYSARRCRTR